MPPQQLLSGEIVWIPPFQKKLAPNPSPLSGSISTSLAGVAACTMKIAGGVTVCHCALSPRFGLPAGDIWNERPCPHSLAVLKLPLLTASQTIPVTSVSAAPSPYPEHPVISIVPARVCGTAQAIEPAPPASAASVTRTAILRMHRRPCISARSRADQLYIEGLWRGLSLRIVGVDDARRRVPRDARKATGEIAGHTARACIDTADHPARAGRFRMPGEEVAAWERAARFRAHGHSAARRGDASVGADARPFADVAPDVSGVELDRADRMVGEADRGNARAAHRQKQSEVGHNIRTEVLPDATVHEGAPYLVLRPTAVKSTSGCSCSRPSRPARSGPRAAGPS